MKYSTKLKIIVYVSSCMSSIYVQLFTAVEGYMYLGECPNIEYGCHFHGNEPQGIFFSLNIFSY